MARKKSRPTCPSLATQKNQQHLPAAACSSASPKRPLLPPLAHNRPTPAVAIDREVRGSLDELKNNIFRLELRRQAGTISEEDYARQRESVEKTLRALVRG